MTAPTPFFAQIVDSLSTRPLGTGTKMVLGDMVWALWLALGLAVILFAWARYGRRSKRREHRSHRPAIVQNSIRAADDDAPQAFSDDDTDDDTDDGKDAEDGEAAADSSSGRHRKRRRRRGHRPRNPTLEEAGGLPATRANDSTSPNA